MVAMAMFSVTEALLDQVSSFPYGPDTMMTREFDEEGVPFPEARLRKLPYLGCMRRMPPLRSWTSPPAPWIPSPNMNCLKI